MNAESKGSCFRLNAFKLPLFLGLVFFAVVAMSWMGQFPTREELMGGVGRTWNLVNIPFGGWSPDYMMGVNSVIYDAFALTLWLSKMAGQLLGGILGPVGAEKLLTLCFIPAAAVSMWFFVRKLGGGIASCSWISLLYVVMPSFHVATGIYEHRVVSICFIFTPWVLRGILAVAQRPTPREVLLLGLAAAALTLSYTKIAVAMAPMLLIWMVLSLEQNRSSIRGAFIGYAWSALVAVFAGLVFLLPALREYGYSAGFQFDPLKEWQHHYSFKTPLLWIDLWGLFIGGGGPSLTDDAAMFWIGAIPLLALTLAMGLPGLMAWRASQQGRWFLILTACWLVSICFAAGPDGLLGNHFYVLKYEQNLSDHAVAVIWLSFVWMGWLIYRTASCLLARSFWWPVILTFLALVLPAFRLVEFFPFFKDIRAPESFWKVGGFCCLTVAVGFSSMALFSEVVAKSWRKRLAIVIGLLMLLELYPVYSSYWTRGLERELFTDFDEAAAFLKTAPLQGRVHALCTRYFFLTLPQKAGRALDTEALHRHFQLKWVRHLEFAGDATPEAMQSYLKLAGVAYILIDKEDPRLSKQSQDFFSSLYPVVFENRFFAVLANEKTLYPAFLARDFVPLPSDSYAMAPTIIQLLPLNVITVEIDGVETDMPGIAGVAQGANHVDLKTKYQEGSGQEFVRIPLRSEHREDSQRMNYQLPASTTGWLVVSEAYHPDWTVAIDGQPAEVRRAEAALLSVFVPLGSREVVFQFQPPAWYSLCRYVGMISWIVAMAALFFLSCGWAPAKWRNWWTGGEAEN